MKLINIDSLKINIDKFNSLSNFELYFFKILKTVIKLKIEKTIVVYTLNQNLEFLNGVSNNIIPKLEKIKSHLNKFYIVIKFINFPYCILKETKLVERYFLNSVFENFEDIIPKKSIECLKCKYYVSCSGIINKNLLEKSFNTKVFTKDEYINKFNLLLNFFKDIGIKKESICFDLKHDKWDFKNISKSIVNRMIIDIDSESVNYSKYFIDLENYREQHRVNLIFKNYIVNKKYNSILRRESISTYIRFISFKGNNYKQYIDKGLNIKYGNLNLEGKFNSQIFNYINEKVPIIKESNIGHTFKGRGNDLFENNFKKLKVILLKDILNIKTNFGNYIVLFNDRHLNNYIPHIYKFRYFLTYNNDVLNSNIAHFQIIFNEMGAFCIDSISTNEFFGLKNDYLLDVNFNSGLIKRIG